MYSTQFFRPIDTRLMSLISNPAEQESAMRATASSIQLFPIFVRQFEQGQALREAILFGL
jgi:hypothetical protein